MKLTELVINQKLIIQLIWGEQKIEFFSNVIEQDGTSVYVSPYFHDGKELELNVTPDKGVVCNIFTNEPGNGKRISWKNLELTTVIRKDKPAYCLKSNGYNDASKHEDRRVNERIIVHINARLFDGRSRDGVDIMIHDISDSGISFYAPSSFSPISNQLTIVFADSIEGREFSVKVECSIARTTKKAGNTFIGCGITGDNRDYLIYAFMKKLMAKNKGKFEEKAEESRKNTEEAKM